MRVVHAGSAAPVRSASLAGKQRSETKPTQRRPLEEPSSSRPSRSNRPRSASVDHLDVLRADRLAALGAHEQWSRRLAAGAVADAYGRALGVAVVRVRPAEEREYRGVEVEAALGKPVLVPIGVGAVAHALEQAMHDELGEALGEHVACDPEVALQLSVAMDAAIRLADDQKTPTVSEQRERLLGGGSLRGLLVRMVLRRQLVSIA